jgi:hypothetical protein
MHLCIKQGRTWPGPSPGLGPGLPWTVPGPVQARPSQIWASCTQMCMKAIQFYVHVFSEVWILPISESTVMISGACPQIHISMGDYICTYVCLLHQHPTHCNGWGGGRWGVEVFEANIYEYSDYPWMWMYVHNQSLWASKKHFALECSNEVGSRRPLANDVQTWSHLTSPNIRSWYPRYGAQCVDHFIL